MQSSSNGQNSGEIAHLKPPAGLYQVSWSADAERRSDTEIRRGPNTCYFVLAVVAWIILAGLSTLAQSAEPVGPAQSPPAAPVIVSVAPKVVRTLGRLIVNIDGMESAGQARVDPAVFRLRLDGHKFENLVPERTGPDEVSFDLTGLRDDKVGWLFLIGDPPPLGVRSVTVRIATSGVDLGTKSGKPVTVELRIFSAARLLIGIVAVGTIVALVSRLGWKSDILRDPAAVPAGDDRPYSLARCQMAFWFLLVTAVFIAIWLITGDYNNIVTGQSLTLLGISGATALGAAAIDGLKTGTPGQGSARPPFHETFWKDLLTDDTGWVFHRVQIVIWTLILGAVSLGSAYDRLALPDLDPNLLILMGLSSGLYLGFKWPEQQSAAGQQPSSQQQRTVGPSLDHLQRLESGKS